MSIGQEKVCNYESGEFEIQDVVTYEPQSLTKSNRYKVFVASIDIKKDGMLVCKTIRDREVKRNMAVVCECSEGEGHDSLC